MSHWIDSERMDIHPFRGPDGEWRWVNSRGFTFVLGSSQVDGVSFTVPVGFDTDLGSIPRWARWLFSPSDPACAKSYVLHDYLNTLTRQRPPGIGVWSSQLAAAVLYEGMRCDGVGVAKAKTIFLAVVLGIARKEW